MIFVLVFGLVAVLGYLAIVGFVIWLTMRLLTDTGRGWKVKGPALAVILFAAWAVPFGDGTLAEIGFERMCAENDAGTKIFRKVEGVEGFRWDDHHVTGKTDTSYGYRFIEFPEKTGDLVNRFVLQEDGTLKEEPHARSIARFAFRLEPRQVIEKYGQQFVRQRSVVYEVSTQETIATYTELFYPGGWIVRSLKGLGAGASLVCPTTPFNVVEFLASVVPAYTLLGERSPK